MDGLRGIYAMWLREIRVYLRERERAISSIVSPLIWIFGFGAGLGASVSIEGVNYQTYIFPGIMAMTVLFTCVFYGMYVIWDRKLDFLKEVLVSPLPRGYVFIGKMLGGVTDAMVQSTVLFVVAFLIGIGLTPYSLLVAVVSLVLIAAFTTSVGLFFGAMLSSMEAFQLISQFVIWPLFLFSGGLFPISNLPSWLAVATYADPLTYGVDALRWAMLGTGSNSLLLDFGVMALASALMMAAGAWAFGRMEKL